MGKSGKQDPLYNFWEGRWKKGETPWDHGRPAPPFAEFVEKFGAPAGQVIIPGSGSGHDVRYFAELDAHVFGLDISPTAIDVAHRLNSHPMAKYRLGNILDPEEKWHGRFDWVIEHTCLCALDPEHWPAYIKGVRKLLKPGGYYLGLLYRNPVYEEGPPFGINDEAVEELFSEGFQLLKAWVPEKSYESRFEREELRWYRFTG